MQRTNFGVFIHAVVCLFVCLFVCLLLFTSTYYLTASFIQKEYEESEKKHFCNHKVSAHRSV